MSERHQDGDINVSLLSLEIDNKGSALKKRIASLRQQSQDIMVWNPDQPQPLSSAPPANAPVIDPWEYLSLGVITPQPKAENTQEQKSLQAIMRGLGDIEKDITVTLPTFSDMSHEKKQQIMAGIADQEANWEALKPADIRIDKEEVNMWGGFLKTAKSSDFIEQKVLTTLERGEIVELVINGFKSFQIVKIRAKNKDKYAMSVIEFTTKNSREGKQEYFIKLPLIEGSNLSILNRETMEELVSYKIQKMFLNTKHRSLIRKFLDLFTP